MDDSTKKYLKLAVIACGAGLLLWLALAILSSVWVLVGTGAVGGFAAVNKRLPDYVSLTAIVLAVAELIACLVLPGSVGLLIGFAYLCGSFIVSAAIGSALGFSRA